MRNRSEKVCECNSLCLFYKRPYFEPNVKIKWRIIWREKNRRFYAPNNKIDVCKRKSWIYSATSLTKGMLKSVAFREFNPIYMLGSSGEGSSRQKPFVLRQSPGTELWKLEDRCELLLGHACSMPKHALANGL